LSQDDLAALTRGTIKRNEISQAENHGKALGGLKMRDALAEALGYPGPELTGYFEGKLEIQDLERVGKDKGTLWQSYAQEAVERLHHDHAWDRGVAEGVVGGIAFQRRAGIHGPTAADLIAAALEAKKAQPSAQRAQFERPTPPTKPGGPPPLRPIGPSTDHKIRRASGKK
jgi:hypothetical protein